MAQVLKEEVRTSILQAALRRFAAQGYPDTTMEEIAGDAGISTGNVYRYFDGKRDLFHEVLPASFVERFRGLLSERLAAAVGAEDVRNLPEEHAYPLAAGRMLDFAIENRLRVVTLLGRGPGTRYDGVREDVVRTLVDGAVRHFLGPGDGVRTAGPMLRFSLEEVYRNFVGTLVRILERFEEPGDIREATAVYSRYHLTGLAALFE